MIVRSLLILAACAVLTLLVTAGPLTGDDEITTVKMVVYPAAEPRPALKYQLLPPLIDRRPGNAAVFYNRIPAERTALFGSGTIWQKLGQWDEAPLSELRGEEARNTIEGLRDIVEDLDRAARSEYCDWQLLIREKMFLTLRLPEFQQTRAYARILAPWIRLKIADGKYQEAAHGLQTGYALGRDLTKAPCLVCGLIGCAIARMMNEQIHEFIQQPDAPNLYWALSRLPRPLVDLRPCFEGEMYIISFSYPDLHDLDHKDYAPDRWQKLLQQTVEAIGTWTSGASSEEDQLLGITRLLHGYPRAKRLLVESGRSPEEVEAMTVPQVILIGAMKDYDDLRDEMFKTLTLPYPQAREGTEAAELKLGRVARSGEEVLPIASMLLPAVQAAKAAEARIDREIALLRTIEALRLYAVAHHGMPPQALDDITEVPVPIDPVREEPFVYRRSGYTAVVDVIGFPGPGRNHDGARYGIQFARKGN